MPEIKQNILEKVHPDDIVNLSYTIPPGMEGIGDKVFYQYRFLCDVILNDGLKHIGDHAFNSTGLKKLVIPSSVTHIGKETFSFCEDLQKVTLHSSLEHIGKGAFFGCFKLDKVVVIAKTGEKEKEVIEKFQLKLNLQIKVSYVVEYEDENEDTEEYDEYTEENEYVEENEYILAKEEKKNNLQHASPHYLRNSFFPAVGFALVANSICLGGLTIAFFLSAATCPVAFALPLLGIAIAALGAGLLLLAASGLAHIADNKTRNIGPGSAS